MNTNLKYFTPREVALHNKVDDLWVMLFGKVMNLTPLCDSNKEDPRIFPILIFGGKDITHFFNDQGEVIHHINPDTGEIDAFLPFRPFMDVPLQKNVEKIFLNKLNQDKTLAENLLNRYRLQRGVYEELFPMEPFPEMPINDGDSLPWWKDDKYVIGLVSSKTRRIKIKNMLTTKTVDLEVCSEDMLDDILLRYLKFNRHARSYTWKYLGQKLDMHGTLQSNGIPDRDSDCDRLRLNEEEFVPTLCLYFNDDLTEL